RRRAPRPAGPGRRRQERARREAPLRHRGRRGPAAPRAPPAAPGLVVSGRVVTAMGVEALGLLRDARRIAAALARCPDEAWEAIGDLFLQAHYPPRLSSVSLCPKCGARNDVDAPYEREFEPSRTTAQSNAEVFPDVDAFDARARTSFERIAGSFAAQVTLMVDDEVPACDDGG